jgi:hypothetical protein
MTATDSGNGIDSVLLTAATANSAPPRPSGVEHRSLRAVNQLTERKRNQGAGGGCPQVRRVDDPERRCTDDEIADGSTAEGCHHAERQRTDDVQPATRHRKDAADRKHDRAEYLDDMEQRHGLVSVGLAQE